MKITEYNNIKNFTYEEYCEYLKTKHGNALYDYFTKTYNKNPKVTRTKEGLVCHHICEDRAIMLSSPKYAQIFPFEYQKAVNLCYCDYLEHLLLHILICEKVKSPNDDFLAAGIGGIVNYLVPELNDFYSGWKTNQQWRMNCHNLVRDDKDVYLTLLKRFKTNCEDYCKTCLTNPESCLLTSFNEEFGLWSKEKNQPIFEEIIKL